MARLLADENFPQPVVEVLRQEGHDILAFYETGQAGQQVSDHDVLALASENQRIVLTLNRKHFIRLHNENADHSGIIVCTFDPDFEGQAQRIHNVLVQQPEMRNTLVRVNRPVE